MRPLLLSYAIAGASAIWLAQLPASSHIWGVFDGITDVVSRLVPNDMLIARSTSNPRVSAPILAIQWLFTPIYLYYWFGRFGPWTSRMRRAVAERSRTLKSSQRYVLLPLAILAFGLWILGDVGLVNFPTLYNGKYVYPMGTAISQFLPIYQMQTALAIYAWLCPIMEVCVAWAFLLFLFNLRTYLTPSHSSDVGTS